MQKRDGTPLTTDTAALQQMRDDINANTDPTVVQAVADGNTGGIAAWYNQDASPAYWLFLHRVESTAVRDVIDAQNVADITDADRGRAVDLLAIRAERGFSGEVASDRSAWDDIFSAASGDESQQAIAALWQRQGSYAEQVYALGTGAGTSSAAPDTTTYQGSVSVSEISAALQS